ncbi:MAG: glycosyltransferase family 4 protein [Polyangiaceae bacterium]|nr:glycosyltransferase family 4 protein [Polyangiaceae bacterium]
MRKRVLFVSKPIAPPFHDGTKCVVRDLALNLSSVEPIVMSVLGAPALEPQGPSDVTPDQRVRMVPVYGSAGAFAPALVENARAAAWLALGARASLWHYVFAPNARTSAMGRWLKRLRRVPVVQTIASAPRRFVGVDQLLFGDVVVAQSEWTRTRLGSAYDEAGVPREARRRVEVIYPPLGEICARTAQQQRRARAALEIPERAPVFVFPGDLETGGGVRAIARALPDILRELPDAVVVMAYRRKTERTAEFAAELERRLGGPSLRLTTDTPDVLALIASSSAVLFPVDDLWGKVDLPIVLLESMALGVPTVVLDQGALREVGGALRVAPGDSDALARAALDLVRDTGRRGKVIAEQKTAVAERHRAVVVAKAYERLYWELMGRA